MVSKNVERTSRRFWVLLILGFFGLDLSIAVIAISMAAGDPSFRSIPGYGERAVAWNERQQQQDEWRETGYVITFERISTDLSPKRLRIHLTDSASQPVPGLSGHVRLFHYTRVASQFVAQLKEQSPSIYVAEVDVSKDGLWNIEVEWLTSNGKKLWYQAEQRWLPSTEALK
jgi:nitrogen fixation protein FixH